jgi:phage-related tail protein
MQENAKNSSLSNSPSGVGGKRANKYKLTLELLETAKGETESREPLQLEFTNHDEIFSIIERIQKKNLLQSKEQAAEFAIGLKMFSEVMLKNRNLPLFQEFAPAFRDFMKKLKEVPAAE